MSCGLVRGGLLLGAVGAAAAVLGCDFEISHRSDFSRMTPPLDAGGQAGDAGAGSLVDGGMDGGAVALPGFRATSFLIELPEGLQLFQEDRITPAVMREDLNFLVALPETASEGAPFPLLLGSGDKLAEGRFGPHEGIPLAESEGTLESSTLRSAGGTEFGLLVRIPFEAVIAVVEAQLEARLAPDGSALSEGLLLGVITGEDAAITFLDVNNNGDPMDDNSPLINFLGNPDRDLDGDGTIDDFTMRVHFEATRVEVQN